MARAAVDDLARIPRISMPRSLPAPRTLASCVISACPPGPPAADPFSLPTGSAGAPGPLRDTEHRPRGLDQPAGAQVGARH